MHLLICFDSKTETEEEEEERAKVSGTFGRNPSSPFFSAAAAEERTRGFQSVFWLILSLPPSLSTLRCLSFGGRSLEKFTKNKKKEEDPGNR